MDALERHVGNVAPGDLPGLIGKLEELRARAWARMALPTPPEPPVARDATPGHYPEHYTAETLAAYMSLPKSTVYKLYRAGVWPHAYKVGRTKGLRIPRADVLAWEAKCARGS
jgi:excisionase family DNA binding protein